MNQRRLIAIDIMRGIAIMAIVLVHRVHYTWSGMQNSATLGRYFASPWAPLVILTIALFTMAGIFYVVSGLVNAYAMQSRVTSGRSTVTAAVRGGVITGVWIVLLNYVQRIFLMNGMIEGLGGQEPEYPIGQLTGLIRNGGPVPFRWTQITEPGTLWLIGFVLVVVSLTLGLLYRREGYRNATYLYRNLGILAVVTLALSPFAKYLLLPYYADAYAAGRYGLALLLGYVSQEFGIFPYLGYGFLGAMLGIALAQGEDLKTIRRRTHRIAIVLGVIGLLGVIIASRKDPLGARIIGASISYIEVALFLFLAGLALQLWDFGDPGIIARRQQRWVGVRRFGMLALTVYTCEPLLAEIGKRVLDALFGRAWADNLLLVLAFGCVCLLIWWGILRLWERSRFIGSAEWLSARAMQLLAAKQSGKLAFETLRQRPAK